MSMGRSKTMKKIFILNGSGGVGKDTFVKYVYSYNNSVKKLTVDHTSSISLVKHYARNIGWKGDKTEKDRKLLSDLKMALTEYNDSPFDSLRECVHTFRNGSYDILFIDIREPEEIERAKKEFDAKTILIKSDRVDHVTSNMADAGVFDYEYDIVIENNGTLEDLFDTAIKFSKEYIFDKE